MAINTISNGQLRTPLVDEKGFIRKEWYSAFQGISAAIVQTINNTTTIIDNESSTLFDDTVIQIPADNSLSNSEVPQAPSVSYEWLLAGDVPIAPAPWTSYFASATPSGAMTFTVSAEDNGYYLDGHTCTVRINVSGTVGGTPDTSIAISLPVQAYWSQSMSGYAIISSNKVPIIADVNGGSVTVTLASGSAFSAGNLTIILTGTWQTLQ